MPPQEVVMLSGNKFLSYRKYGSGVGSQIVVTIDNNEVARFVFEGDGWRPRRELRDNSEFQRATEHINKTWPRG